MAFVLSGGARTTDLIVPDPGAPLANIAAADVGGDVWRTQPNVRTVVDFVARNVASIPLAAYEHVGETDRRRLRTHPLARSLARPQVNTPPFRFWHAILVDWLLYDRWIAAKIPQDDGRIALQRLPAERCWLSGNAIDQVEAIIFYDANGRQQTIDPTTCVFDHGYAVADVNGTSPIETLSDVLEEEHEAVKYRRQVWANGARVPAVIQRPNDAPEWSQQARSRFRESMRAYLDDGAQAGGVPILEDGMSLSKVEAFTPADTNDIAGRQLSATTVAAAFHVPPELVGFRQGNYSNVREYRQQLYRDVLGPLVAAIEQTVNTMLTPDVDESGEVYAEFNVDAKLRGSLEEQASMIQSAVGAPWMTRNEARALQNRPALDEADELVTPLNVTTGGLASPRDTAPAAAQRDEAPQAASRQVKMPAEADEPSEDNHTLLLGRELAAFHQRQAQAVLSRLGAKAGPDLAAVWDTERWNAELARVLAARFTPLALAGANTVLARFNPSSDGFAAEVMTNYLLTAAASHAAEINNTTYTDLAEAMAGESWRDGVRKVFTSRAEDAHNRASSLATEAVNFGSHDAARASGLSSKRWVTTSTDPRSQHQAMHGESVPVEAAFSNGGRWPGDGKLPPWERVNCRCRLEYLTEGSE